VNHATAAGNRTLAVNDNPVTPRILVAGMGVHDTLSLVGLEILSVFKSQAESEANTFTIDTDAASITVALRNTFVQLNVNNGVIELS